MHDPREIAFSFEERKLIRILLWAYVASGDKRRPEARDLFDRLAQLDNHNAEKGNHAR